MSAGSRESATPVYAIVHPVSRRTICAFVIRTEADHYAAHLTGLCGRQMLVIPTTNLLREAV